MVDPKKGKRGGGGLDGHTTAPLGSTVNDPASERWESEEEEARFDKTVRMAAPRLESERPPVPRPGPRGSAGRGVELFVIDDAQLPGTERRAWRAAEIWTKRRVYGLDSTFRCIEILDRATGKPETTHELLGARLGGGRLRERDEVKFSYPLPLPGMEAMFTKQKKHGYTSPVERMIVRIRVLHTSPEEAAPSWDEIASRWSEPPSAMPPRRG